ncbi:MAG: hypothetical protein Q8R48_04130, partial [Candidatus Omnitrophota bacterium]|nr:hypothetical protein [Candidatus Omnitrophota bacterium]
TTGELPEEIISVGNGKNTATGAYVSINKKMPAGTTGNYYIIIKKGTKTSKVLSAIWPSGPKQGLNVNAQVSQITPKQVPLLSPANITGYELSVAVPSGYENYTLEIKTTSTTGSTAFTLSDKNVKVYGTKKGANGFIKRLLQNSKDDIEIEARWLDEEGLAKSDWAKVDTQPIQAPHAKSASLIGDVGVNGAEISFTGIAPDSANYDVSYYIIGTNTIDASGKPVFVKNGELLPEPDVKIVGIGRNNADGTATAFVWDATTFTNHAVIAEQGLFDGMTSSVRNQNAADQYKEIDLTGATPINPVTYAGIDVNNPFVAGSTYELSLPNTPSDEKVEIQTTSIGLNDANKDNRWDLNADKTALAYGKVLITPQGAKSQLLYNAQGAKTARVRVLKKIGGKWIPISNYSEFTLEGKGLTIPAIKTLPAGYTENNFTVSGNTITFTDTATAEPGSTISYLVAWVPGTTVTIGPNGDLPTGSKIVGASGAKSGNNVTVYLKEKPTGVGKYILYTLHGNSKGPVP